MSRFVALVERDDDAFGVFFPQLPGCVAMGASLDEAIGAATDALAEWVRAEADVGRTYEAEDLSVSAQRDEVRDAIASGAVPVFVPLVSESGRPVRANLSIDDGLLQAIDGAARARGLTRSSWLASAARKALEQGY